MVNPAVMSLPGHTSRRSRRLETSRFGPKGRFGTNRRTFEDQAADYTIVTGTPDTVIPEDQARAGDAASWERVLLGLGRRDDSRGPDAEPEIDGRLRDSGGPGDWG